MLQCAERNAPLYINVVDFEKAFYSIHIESIWLVMKHYVFPDKKQRMVKLLYEAFECAVLDERNPSE